MVVNVSCRTDIPGCYSQWFYERIRQGYVLSRNPYNTMQVLRYRLTPDVVDCLSFCTKNPIPMLDQLSCIDQFRQFWSVTITPYGREIEPNVPKKENVIAAFQQLSRRYGIRAVSWRYDPIFINECYTMEKHIQSFQWMAEKLQGYTDHCVISFLDLYEKTKRNFQGVRNVTEKEIRQLVPVLVEIGQKYGIRIKSCCEMEWLKEYGVDVSGCMTQQVIERAIDCTMNVPKKKAARQGCDCLLGNDLGAYNTCWHGCVYCYANYNKNVVDKNRIQHDPKSPLLIGTLNPEDVVVDAKQESYLDGQMRLFF